MAPPSVVGAVAGGYLAGAIPEWLLLTVIAAVLLQAAVELLRNPPKPPGGEGGELDVARGRAERRGHRRARRPRRPDPRLAADARAAALGRRDAAAGGRHERHRRRLRRASRARSRTCPTRRRTSTLIAVGGAASIPGALLGSRLTGRLSEEALIKAIAVVLLVAAAGCIAQALT